MDALKALKILAVSVVLMLAAIAAVNYLVDPQCYYRCGELDLRRPTLNVYYKTAQRILAHPDAQVIILGSSRGETTPPLWFESLTGLKTLNLSSAGAELTTKLTFLKIAEEQTQVKKVIWLADYFELINETADAMIKNTPALQRYLKGVTHEPEPMELMKRRLHDLQSLIDHKTLESSLSFLGKKDHLSSAAVNQGAGSELDFKRCASSEFMGQETAESLKKEVDLIYQSYSQGTIKPTQREESWQDFERAMRSLTAKGLDIAIVIAPYHPEFTRRLKAEQPEIFERHAKWVRQLEGLAGEKITVLNYFEGIPGENASPALWNDGVHYTCQGSIRMLEKLGRVWGAAPTTAP